MHKYRETFGIDIPQDVLIVMAVLRSTCNLKTMQ